MSALTIIICIIVGYACGNLNTAYIVGKFFYNTDIRQHGSGNLGATNTLRTLGKKAGIIVLLGDFFKVLLPAIIVRLVVGSHEYTPLLCEIIGVGGVLGHCYPVALHFKGGKGIASTGGAMIATSVTYLPFAPIFAAIVLLTGYVSVGSMFVVSVYPLWMLAWFHDNAYLLPMFLVGLLFTASGFYTHRENIKRLMNGTENKFGQKKEEN